MPAWLNAGGRVCGWCTFGALLTVTVLALQSCIFKPDWQTQAQLQWQAVSANIYQAEITEIGLLLEFEVADRQFSWRFKNNGRHLIRIDLQQSSLRLRDDKRAYAFWGDVKPRDFQLPPVDLAPGGFLQQQLPVRFASPFYPFQPERGYWAELIILTQERRLWRSLSF